MKKVYVMCPFCAKVIKLPNKSSMSLWTMGNGDYVYIPCTFCEKKFWITEEDYDKFVRETER